jgi:hypothetical protein
MDVWDPSIGISFVLLEAGGLYHKFYGNTAAVYIDKTLSLFSLGTSKLNRTIRPIFTAAEDFNFCCTLYYLDKTKQNRK